MLNVVGLFKDATDAQDAVSDLINAGIDRGDISLISPGDKSMHKMTDEASHTGSGAGTGAGTGAGIGATLGGIGGLLAGLGALVIPGFGPLVAAGPIIATLTGAVGGAGIGAVTGGVIGALTDMGVPEEEAKYYSEGIKSGGTLVAVQARDQDSASRIAAIMRRHHAENVDRRGAEYESRGAEHRGNEYESRDGEYQESRVAEPEESRVAEPEESSGRFAAVGENSTLQEQSERQSRSPRSDIASEETVIPIVEEELKVGKRTVEGGGVRIYTKVTDRPVEESVQLRDEHITIERRAADRPVNEGDKLNEGVIELTTKKEEPVVGKQRRIVEEIIVRKEAQDRTETVRDTVRRQDVKVEERDNQGNLRKQ